jgi:peptide deformylase
MSERNSDTIIFDTSEALKIKPVVEPIRVETFSLVSENDPILKEVMPEFDFDNPPVDPNKFASSLVETCIKNKGYGLSANQCGFRYRVFVMGGGNEYVAFFNPKIVATYDESHMVEGCLSFPMLALRITRPAAIDVEYQDYNGKVKTAHYTGISARCFLHELDHMNGIVYTNRAKPISLQQGMKKRNKIKGLLSKAEKNLTKMEKLTA